jgi:hypothetical protein
MRLSLSAGQTPWVSISNHLHHALAWPPMLLIRAIDLINLASVRPNGMTHPGAFRETRRPFPERIVFLPGKVSTLRGQAHRARSFAVISGRVSAAFLQNQTARGRQHGRLLQTLPRPALPRPTRLWKGSQVSRSGVFPRDNPESCVPTYYAFIEGLCLRCRGLSMLRYVTSIGSLQRVLPVGEMRRQISAASIHRRIFIA